MVCPVLHIVSGIKIKLMPPATEHLGNNVFHNHALVNIQFIKKHRLIKLVIGKCLIHKGECNQQTGICHIAFLCGVVRAERQLDVGIGSIKAGVGYHCFI